MSLEHLMHKTLLVLEVVIELALSSSRGFYYLVRAGKVYPLLVKQVSRCLNNPKLCVGSSGIVSFHNFLPSCTIKYNYQTRQWNWRDGRPRSSCTRFLRYFSL